MHSGRVRSGRSDYRLTNSTYYSFYVSREVLGSQLRLSCFAINSRFQTESEKTGRADWR